MSSGESRKVSGEHTPFTFHVGRGLLREVSVVVESEICSLGSDKARAGPSAPA